MASPRTDDDELPALPPLDGGDEDEVRPAGEEDELDEEDESVGLDVSTGEDELDEELDGEDGEGESYLEGSEPGEIDDGNDDDLAAGEDERGWRAFAETDDAPDDELDEPDGEAIATVDRGEEGLEDDEPVRGNEDDDAELPPSVAEVGAPDLPDDALDVREAGEIEVADLPADAERRLSGAELPPAVPASRVTATWLDVDGVVAALALSRGQSPEDAVGLLAAGTSLMRVGERSVRLAAAGLEAPFVTSLAVHPTDARRIVAGTRLAGAFVSVDGGETFGEANGWRRTGGAATSALQVVVERHAGGVRLWGLAGGALHRSDDFGATWAGPLLVAPVAALASCARGEGGVAAVSLARGSARLLRSTDGGLGWSARALPPVPAGAASSPSVALCGDVVAVAYDRDPAGALLLDLSDGRAAEGEAARVVGLAAATHLCFSATGELWAVLFFPGTDRSVLVRRDREGAVATVADVGALGAARRRAGDLHDEGDGRVLALVAHDRTAWLATPRGVLRVVVAG